MDMVGPLPPTEDGYRYVLMICDYGTRYPEAFPLRTTSSKDVAEALEHLFSRTGFPKEILTDRGSNFCSDLMEELFHRLGIRHIRTSAYHPETDGMVERYNGTLKAGIRKYLAHFHGEWHKALPHLMFAFREQPHSSTGLSPFELLYGRNPRGLLDVLSEEWTEPTSTKESVVSHMVRLYENLRTARETAEEAEKEAKDYMKAAYDIGSRERTFEVDDLVLVLLPSSTNKLQAQWQGPFPISEKLGAATYKVRMSQGKKGLRTFHVNLLPLLSVCLLTWTTLMFRPGGTTGSPRSR